jgi:hypothetical protein
LKIFGPEGENITGEWGKLCNEELYNLRWTRAYLMHGSGNKFMCCFGYKLEGKS